MFGRATIFGPSNPTTERRRTWKRLLALLTAVVLASLAATSAGAITRGGTLDGDDHPYVGLMLALDADGAPLWRCTGTLISPTVFVTAGHCTESPAASAEVFFQSDLEPDPAVFGYPFGPYDASTHGTTYVHPLFDPDAFYLYDLGVVKLDEPVILSEYASLPSAGFVDTLANGRKNNSVTVVGYGLQAASSNPVKPEKTVAAKTRYQAELMIVNTRGAAGIGNLPDSNSMMLSGDAKHGGTCFGDSGGPTLVGDTLLAVTSFGLNGNCAGVGGVFRIDRQAELDWISSFE
ncbi:MAG: trypsin-like serine protease [Acidimicrobiales bacterium]